MPVILTGDFNTTPDSDTFTLLTRGWINHHIIHQLPVLGIACLVNHQSEALSHSLGLRCVQSPHYEVTTQQEGWVMVDYIFYSTVPSRNPSKGDGRKEGSLKLLGRLGLPNSQQMARVGNIPNQFIPSDHLPLVVDFLLSSDKSTKIVATRRRSQERERTIAARIERELDLSIYVFPKAAIQPKE